MNGATNEIVLTAEVNGVDVDPYGNEKVGLEVTGQLSRGAYGMTFNQALGSGNMLVADKVKLALDISAAKQAYDHESNRPARPRAGRPARPWIPLRPIRSPSRNSPPGAACCRSTPA
jgi:hypothetical protein